MTNTSMKTAKQMFLATEDHNKFLFECVEHGPDKVFISTFGTYLGMTYDGRDSTQWGEEYKLATRDLAEKMRTVPDVEVLVGISNYRSCKGNIHCIDCEKQYVRTLLRHINHAELFPEFTWKMTVNLHLKSTIFYYDGEEPVGVTGGRNFTDSDWTDVTFTIDPQEIALIEELASPVWDEAYDVSDSNVSKILETQNISKEGFESVIAGIDTLDDKDEEVPF